MHSAIASDLYCCDITKGKSAHRTPAGIRERHTCIGLISKKNCFAENVIEDLIWAKSGLKTSGCVGLYELIVGIIAISQFYSWVLFCYIRTVFRLNCLTAQPSYEGRAAVEGGK
jgi:hypothetical protein